MYTPPINDFAENTGDREEADRLQAIENEKAYEKMRENGVYTEILHREVGNRVDEILGEEQLDFLDLI